MHRSAQAVFLPKKPPDNHQALALSLDVFLGFCEQHDLPVRLQGDLLRCWQIAAYLLPGTQDFRLSLPIGEREKLQSAFAAENQTWTLEWQNDEDCRVLWPGATLTLTFPRTKTTVNAWRETLFMGYRVFVPLDAARFWEENASPLRPLKEVATEEQITDLTQPFIYRRFLGLPAEEDVFEKWLLQEREVYGYGKVPIDNSEDWDLGYLTGSQVWRAFKNNNLKINVVDSECSNPEPLLRRWHSRVLHKPPFIGWVLTNAYKVTFFHLDPAYGNCFMYLCRGKKIWYFISPDDLACLENRYGFSVVNRLPLPELLELDDRFLWGKIQVGMIGSGDLLYFPDHWPHFVRTLEHSFGYGGYFGQKMKE